MKKPSAKTCKSLSVLVLDDNPAWRQIVKSILKSDLGISPLLAASGQEALNIVKVRPVSLVVADLNMPVMNGIEFLERVRPQSPATKVVIMSADFEACRAMSPELMARGAFAVVPKNEITSKLVNLLRTLKESECTSVAGE